MLFHVFIYCISSLQIFHLYEFFFTNNSQIWEILRNYYTIFRSSHRRCSIKKAILKHFVIFTGKHLCRSLFVKKVAGRHACNFIKKTLQHRYCLVNIRKFIRRTILKNISKQLHCWKVFYQKIFHIKSELSKRNY